MPPKATTPKLTGTLLLNAKQMFHATACEITPAGNGKYAVTIRTTLEQTPEMFVEDFKGKVTVVYRHKFMPDIRLMADFLDYGLQDENGQCILSLFFRAEQEASPIVSLPKPSIQLAK